MLLVTGFSSFPGVDANPSGLLVERWRKRPPRWASADAHFEVLSTAYGEAGERIAELASSAGPAKLVMLGVGRAARSIELERFALNVDDADTPDAAGEVRRGLRIEPDGPIALETSFDLWSARDHLASRGPDVIVSNHAGTYVCNHVYYVALRAARLRGAGLRPLLVHVPLASHASEEAARDHLDDLETRLGALVGWLLVQ